MWIKEILESQKESAQQYERNKQYYEKNRAIYRNSIRKLTEKLRICLETQDETFPEMATHGKINPREVWKAVYLDNPRVFERKEEVEIPGFSVDMLIDASSSRKQMQEQIAAQAYPCHRTGIACTVCGSLKIMKKKRLEMNYSDMLRQEITGTDWLCVQQDI